MQASYRNRLGTILGLVGACTLGAAQNAHAQSSVTLYGIVDGSLLYTSKTLNPATGQSAGHQYSLSLIHI